MKRLVIFGFVGFVLVGCARKIDEQIEFDLSLETAVNSVDVEGEIIVESGHKITDKGVVYSVEPNPDLADNQDYVFNVGAGNEPFQMKLTDLLDNQIYHYKAFAVVDGYPYMSQEYTFKTDCPNMGCGPAGGYVIYDDGLGGGIECAPFDIYLNEFTLELFQFGCLGTLHGNYDATVGAGSQNTTNIVSNCGVYNCAAYGCSIFEWNGYNDWYLPSYDELSLMYTELAQDGWGKFQGIYHSSTENNQNYSRAINFDDFQEYILVKTAGAKVRPVRSF